ERTTQIACDRGPEKLLSLPTFFAAAKKVGAAPHRGNANRPTRTRDPANPEAKAKAKAKAKNQGQRNKIEELAPKRHALRAIAIAPPLR
ncbi:hypothetical protein MHM92_31130, partial [Caballeronia zhejiangensis]|nr:hypothetical protein [Caballeronia zhejiangensis]